MFYLQVNNLTKSYTSKVLVDHVDFTISKGQKVALVAKNGAGKSTLLKLLMKELDLSDGTIEWREGIRIGYLPQDIQVDESKTVREFLFDFDTMQLREQEVQLTITINKLRITPYLDQIMGSLSGGEKKRVALTKVLMGDPEMLILDEPTNHLDLDMIERLERYLKHQHTTLLMVTHDRYFLERVCSDIFELHRGKIIMFPGNYSYYLERKAIRDENEQIEVHKLKQLYRKELNWIRRAPSGRQTKSDFRSGRFDNIDEHYDIRKDLLFKESKKLKLSVEARPLGGKILKLKHIKKSFGNKKILADFFHEFRHNERIGIIGKNGVGKSTFVRMILGEESVDSGVVQTGETVVFGHYQQKDIHFPDDKRVIDIIHDRHLLEQFLFPPSQQHMFAEKLSGGEKRRLYLLTILQTNPNFLILDEPTNDLDLLTIGVLEEFLIHYTGCLIVVSHDRFFMDRIADHLFVFEGEGVVKDFWGTYSEYKEQETVERLKGGKVETLQRGKIEKLKDGKMEKGSQNKEQLKGMEKSTEDKKKLSYMERRELDQLSKDIHELEKKRDEINRIFERTDIPYDDIRVLSEELGTIVRQIEQKEYRWFELSDRE